MEFYGECVYSHDIQICIPFFILIAYADNSFPFLLQSYLEEQGPRIVRAKERFDLIQEKKALSKGLSMPRASAPPPKNRIVQHNVTLTPTKKRTWTMLE